MQVESRYIECVCIYIIGKSLFAKGKQAIGNIPVTIMCKPLESAGCSLPRTRASERAWGYPPSHRQPWGRRLPFLFHLVLFNSLHTADIAAFLIKEENEMSYLADF